MAEAEVVLREAYAEAAILRISLRGAELQQACRCHRLDPIAFRHGRPATLYFDEVRSCTTRTT